MNCSVQRSCVTLWLNEKNLMSMTVDGWVSVSSLFVHLRVGDCNWFGSHYVGDSLSLVCFAAWGHCFIIFTTVELWCLFLFIYFIYLFIFHELNLLLFHTKKNYFIFRVKESFAPHASVFLFVFLFFFLIISARCWHGVEKTTTTKQNCRSSFSRRVVCRITLVWRLALAGCERVGSHGE